MIVHESPLQNLMSLLLFVFFLFFFISCSGSRPDLGIMNEKLLPCPGSPNCVNSEYQGTDSYIEPLSFSENSQTAWKNLKTTIENMGGTISKETPSYLRCTFTSKIFRFVDDVEFRMDEKLSQIHMRSASRKGYSDLGVNRNRMERLRKKFNQMRNNLQP